MRKRLFHHISQQEVPDIGKYQVIDQRDEKYKFSCVKDQKIFSRRFKMNSNLH